MEAPTRPDFVFVPARAGFWSESSLAVSAHESLHACAAVVCGVTVLEARIDSPGVDGTLGHCRTLKHPDKWRRAVHAIAPPAIAQTAGDRLNMTHEDSDIAHASQAFYEAEWPGTWSEFVAAVREMLRTPPVRTAVTSVSSALLKEGALPGWRIHDTVEEVLAGASVDLQRLQPS